MATNLDVPSPGSINNKLSRLEASCNELFSEIETKHKLLKESFVKCVAEKSRRKSEGRKSITNIGNTTKSLSLLTEHIESLKNLKEIYTKSFILAIRNEVEIMWDKCCYGESQRSSFQPYFADIFTVEVLEEHEQQLLILKEYYTSNKELYKLVSKREKLWQEKVAFENPADGCSRFENRGGTLIKELKKYQMVEKQLPIVEKEIRLKIKSWEKGNENKFMMQDLQYMQYIETQKQDYKTQQEAKRAAKRAAKQEELLAEKLHTANPVTKKAPVHDAILSKTVCKEMNHESLKELMRPTESSLLKMRECSTPAARLSQLSKANSTLKRSAPPSRLHQPHKKTSEEGKPAKLTKLDLSCAEKSPPLEHKMGGITLLSHSIRKETWKENAQPSFVKSMKTPNGVKKRLVLQSDAMKRKQKRKSLSLKQTDKKPCLKEINNVTCDYEENQS